LHFCIAKFKISLRIISKSNHPCLK
jgi:hypothetical protein